MGAGRFFGTYKNIYLVCLLVLLGLHRSLGTPTILPLLLNRSALGSPLQLLLQVVNLVEQSILLPLQRGNQFNLALGLLQKFPQPLDLSILGPQLGLLLRQPVLQGDLFLLSTVAPIL